MQKCMKRSIIPPFCQVEPVVPSSRAGTHTPEIVFQTLINPLCLAISLGMVSCGQVQLNFQCFEHRLPYCTSEYRVPISEDDRGKTM